MLLVEGNSNTQVKNLQHGLRMLCFNPKRLDGLFDANTTSAVKRYQTAKGLYSDGKVGDNTWNKLKSDIKPIQSALKNKGFYTGSIDGIADIETYNALLKFQSASGLTADGMAGTGTVNKLYASDSSKPLLQRGSTGIHVIDLQKKLINLGYACGDTGADGIFGDDTYRAVRLFQQNNGLNIDGKVGENTWAKLENATPNATTNTPLLVLGSSGEPVIRVQTRLIELEYDCGITKADGIFGAATQKAVINFQKNNGLTPDGKVGTNTWHMLNSSTPVKGSGANCSLLRVGSTGAAVSTLQNRLILLGYNCGKSGADGTYGNNTKLAVIKFQRINSLNPDGIAGSITLERLYSDSAKPNDGSADNPIYPTIPTLGNLLDYTIEIISTQEGSYNAVNPTDVLSIGLLQWRASRAYDLLLTIRNSNIKCFDAIMSGTTIGEYIITQNAIPFETLTPQSISSAELAKLKQLLDTEESHQVQDDLKRSDVNGYIEYGKKLGISDEQVLIYFSDCYNQSPSGISRIGNKFSNHWNTITLDTFHNYALQDIYEKSGKKYGLGLYKTRRSTVYDKASKYTNETNLSLSTFVENMVLYALAEEHSNRFEGLPESDYGKENYNKYNKWFPSLQGNAWCACFVSWCANKAGLLNVSSQLGLIPKSVSVKDYLDFYQSQNRFGDKNSYQPKRGDIFIKKSNGSSHVGIVTSFNPKTNEYTTIEGNTDDDTVKQLTRSINNDGLTGFGINTP